VAETTPIAAEQYYRSRMRLAGGSQPNQTGAGAVPPARNRVKAEPHLRAASPRD